jgi:Zn-dependent metalloprotease
MNDTQPFESDIRLCRYKSIKIQEVTIMKKNKIIINLVFLSLQIWASFAGYTQNQNEINNNQFKEIQLNNQNNSPSFVKVRDDYQVSSTQNQQWLKEVLKLQQNDSMILISVEKDKLGYIHYRYKQSYNGFPVEGSMYIVHTKEGKVISANGNFIPDINISSIVNITEKAALKNATNAIKASIYSWNTTSNNQTIIVDSTLFPKAKLVVVLNNRTSEYEVAYKFDVFTIEPLGRESVFINASTGELIKKLSTLTNADEQANVTTHYTGTQSITHDNSNGTYYLREYTRGDGIQTLNLKNSTNFNNAAYFTSTTNDWSSLSDFNRVALDVQWAGEKIYDYYFNVHGRNSIDGNGYQLTSYVHYSKNYANAFWNGQFMVFGDGNSKYSSFTTIDICAHEITHGLTEFSANLGMEGEAYALNESYSDIFGMLIEKYALPDISDSLNFIIGEDVISGGIRSMAHPKLYDCASTYKGQNWDTSYTDPYVNGAVNTHWFYILTFGEKGKNDNNQSYNIQGIGRDEAAQIAFRTLTVYLTPTSTFQDARFYSVQSAIDIFGACSPEVIKTTNAWYAVGVGDSFSQNVQASFEYSTELCSHPVRAMFYNASSNASTYLWDFGDGETSSALSPEHIYKNSGLYKVSLTAKGCDNSTNQFQLNPLNIDNTIICDTVIMTQSGTIATDVNCRGLIFDSGGDTTYNPNSDGVNTITTNSKNIKLSFLTFDYQYTSDYVNVYDGATVNDKLIGKYNYANLPETDIISTGNSLTIQEITGQWASGHGFAAYWECQGVNSVSAEKTDADIVIYPNPASDYILIEPLSNFNGNLNISITNMLGKVVINRNYIMSNATLKADLNNQADGIYIVKMDFNGVQINKKLTIRR